MMVVQLGLAMMPRGRSSASAALHSGTTRGTSLSMRKAEELSIITAPNLVMSAANSFDVPAPAEVKAMSTSLKSSLCWSSFTVYSLPRKVYLVPALRLEPKSRRLSMGKSRSASTRRNSWPTAPLAPTIATFMWNKMRFSSFVLAFCFCFIAFAWQIVSHFPPQKYDYFCLIFLSPHKL